MNSLFLVLVVAIIGGVAIALQAQFTGILDDKVGTLESVFITYFGGGVLILIITLARRSVDFNTWQGIPWYAFSAGALGLVIIGSISYSVPRLGLAAAFTILVASQFIFGALIDHFGLLGADVRPLDLSRLLGIVVLLLGTWLIIR
ncbi:MAG: DMT family transporter [Chloroflexota bacterium]